MVNFNFDLGIPKSKMPKAEIPKIKIEKVHITKVGDRTRTPAQNRKLKEKRGCCCERCGKKFDKDYLHVHHKKSVAKYKSPYGVDTPIITFGEKYIPKYDRRESGLQVLCIKCHNKTKKQSKKKKPLWQTL